PLLACPVTASPSLLVVSPLIAYSKTSRTPLPGIRTRKRAGRVEPTPHARPSAPLPSPPPTGGPRTCSQRSTGSRRSVVAWRPPMREPFLDDINRELTKLRERQIIQPARPRRPDWFWPALLGSAICAGFGLGETFMTFRGKGSILTGLGLL